MGGVTESLLCLLLLLIAVFLDTVGSVVPLLHLGEPKDPHSGCDMLQRSEIPFSGESRLQSRPSVRTQYLRAQPRGRGIVLTFWYWLLTESIVWLYCTDKRERSTWTVNL